MGGRLEPRRWVLVLLGVQTMAGCAMGFVMVQAGAHAAARRHLPSLSSTQATASCKNTRTRRDVIQKLGLLASPILWGTPVLATPAGGRLRGHIRSATSHVSLHVSGLSVFLCMSLARQ